MLLKQFKILNIIFSIIKLIGSWFWRYFMHYQVYPRCIDRKPPVVNNHCDTDTCLRLPAYVVAVFIVLIKIAINLSRK